MSFSVEVQTDQVVVEAGSTFPLAVTLVNQGEADQFEIQVEGIDADWVAVPMPIVQLGSGASTNEKLFFKPPRTSESLAGNYPFVIRVRSLSHAEAKTVQGVLTVKPYHHLTMELTPKRGAYGPTRRDHRFLATVINLGNTEHTLQLFGNDPEDALTYVFHADQITIGPGQTKSIEVEVMPAQTKSLANTQLHGFSIGARSIDTPSIACSAQAQLEERAWLTPGVLAAVVFVIALFIGWFALLPKPARMDELRLSERQVVQGDSVTISWRATNAQGVTIHFDEEQMLQTQQLIGQFTFPAQKSGVISARAIRDGKASEPVIAQLIVTPKPVAPDPKITRFSVSPPEVNKGDRITIDYEVDAAVTELILQPTGEELDPKLQSKWIAANFEGQTTFWLVARNADGKEVQSRKVKINVVDPTLPKIRAFTATPSVFSDSPTTIQVAWQTVNASRIEIAFGTTREELAEANGVREYLIEGTTEFTLTIWDSQDRKDVKKVTVRYAAGERPAGTNPPAVTTTGGG